MTKLLAISSNFPLTFATAKSESMAKGSDFSPSFIRRKERDSTPFLYQRGAKVDSCRSGAYSWARIEVAHSV